jgi:O-methyltransferase
MNGFAGSSRPKKRKQELAGSNGVVLALKTESADPVVGLAVRIVEFIAIGKQMTYCLSGVARLGVADHMNATPMAVEEIAGKTGAHVPSLYRVMRMLASMGVFEEEQGKRFALTPAGELLKSDAPGTMRYFAMMFGDEWTTRAYEHFIDCLRTGQDGVSKAYGQHVFDVLAERPEQSDTFQAAMTSSSTMDRKAVTRAYDFSGIKCLADVGGGHGALLASILRR